MQCFTYKEIKAQKDDVAPSPLEKSRAETGPRSVPNASGRDFLSCQKEIVPLEKVEAELQKVGVTWVERTLPIKKTEPGGSHSDRESSAHGDKVTARWEAEASRSVCSRSSWSVERAPGHPGLQKNLSRKTKWGWGCGREKKIKTQKNSLIHLALGR